MLWLGSTSCLTSGRSMREDLAHLVLNRPNGFMSARRAPAYRPRCADDKSAARIARWRLATRPPKTLHPSSCPAVEIGLACLNAANIAKLPYLAAESSITRKSPTPAQRPSCSRETKLLFRRAHSVAIRAQSFRAANLVELHSAPAALVRSSCARHDTSQPSTRARCPIHSLI